MLVCWSCECRVFLVLLSKDPCTRKLAHCTISISIMRPATCAWLLLVTLATIVTVFSIVSWPSAANYSSSNPSTDAQQQRHTSPSLRSKPPPSWPELPKHGNGRSDASLQQAIDASWLEELETVDAQDGVQGMATAWDIHTKGLRHRATYVHSRTHHPN